MWHPHDTLLQAHLDGELEPPEMREVTRHLSLCEMCRDASAELARLGYGFSEMILKLDETEPAEWRASALLPLVPAAAAVAAAQGAGSVPLTGGIRHALRPRLTLERPAPARARRQWRWAAVALLAVTSVAAAAEVARPLLRGSHRPSTPRIATTSPALLPPLRSAGAIAITPRRRAVEVALTGPAAGSRLHVTIGGGKDLTVSVRSDSASVEPARFRTGDARIAVQLPRAVSQVDVQVPAAARAARITVGDSVVATVEDGRITPAAAAANGIPLAPVR